LEVTAGRTAELEFAESFLLLLLYLLVFGLPLLLDEVGSRHACVDICGFRGLLSDDWDGVVELAFLLAHVERWEEASCAQSSLALLLRVCTGGGRAAGGASVVGAIARFLGGEETNEAGL
jgi:hypothetical protein